jgi:hypothetical protein
MSDKATPTFIAEDIPFSTATTVSGTSLRLSYVFRAESKYIGNIFLARIANPGDATIDIENYDEKTWEILRNVWRKEAEIKYPDEGDYVMQVYDPITELPIPLGEDVVFIGGEVMVAPGGEGCLEYILDLTGVDPAFSVSIIYEDCFLKTQYVTNTFVEMENLQICVGRGLPKTNAGVFTYIAPCNYFYGQPACDNYSWDLSGVPDMTSVTMDYKDCGGTSQLIDDRVINLGPYVSICAQTGTIVVSHGIVTLIGDCVT